MRTIAALMIFLGAVGFGNADVYKVLNRRPSAILANIVQSKYSATARVYRIAGGPSPLVPAGVTLKADDAASTIEIEGNASQIEDMKRLLQEFDVRPKQVKVEINLISKLDKYDSSVDATVNNNSDWTFTDATTGLTVTFRPRINADGSVSSSFEVVRDGHPIALAIRMNRDKSYEIVLADPTPTNPAGVLDHSVAPHFASAIQLKVAVQVKDDPGQPAKKAPR